MSKPLPVAVFTIALCIGALAGPANASITFTFAEVGGTVTMTSSGILDTTKLVSSSLPDGWGGTGIENNGPGDIDIMGGTSFGPIDAQFGFNAGTDASDITNPGGPFTFSDFSPFVITGSTSFTTYSGFLGNRQPGIGMIASDIIGGLWTPNQNWIYIAGTTFASLGLNVGTYAVSDILTGETITIQVGDSGAVPEPSALAIWGGVLGLFGLVAGVRRKLSQPAIA